MLTGNVFCPRCGRMLWVEMAIRSTSIIPDGLKIDVEPWSVVTHECDEPAAFSHLPPQDER